MLVAMQIDVFLGLFASISQYKFSSIFEILNYLLAFIILSFYVFIFVEYLGAYLKLIRMSSESTKKQKLKKLKTTKFTISQFYTEINLKNHISPTFYNLMLIKDTLVPFLLINLLKYPSAQISVLLATSIFSLATHSIARIFSSTKTHTISIVSDILYSIAMALFSLLYFFQNRMTLEEKYNYIGYPLVLVVILIVSINALDAIIDMIIVIYSKIKRIFLKENESKKVAPKTKRTEMNLQIQGFHRDKAHL